MGKSEEERTVIRPSGEEGRGRKGEDSLPSLSFEHGRRVPTLFKYLSVGSKVMGRKWLCSRGPKMAYESPKIA